MLNNQQILEIQQLLETGLSCREVARRKDVSHGTVAAVARGRRTPHLDHQPEAEEVPQVVQRCPACGARVLLPCVACRARQYALSQQRLGIRRTIPCTRSFQLVAGMANPHRRPTRRPPRRVA